MGDVAYARQALSELVGQLVELVYSRVDADGTLREARVAPADANGASPPAAPAADSS